MPKVTKLIIKGRLPSLNEYINECRKNRYAGAKMKRDIQDEISWSIKAQLKRKLEEPLFISFTWYEPNSKRDLDNIAFAKKFILDALVENEKIKNDSWAVVKGFKDTFKLDKLNPRIEVEISEWEADT